MSELERFTLNLIPEAVEALARSSDRDRVNKSDITNRAIQVYDFLRDAEKKGRRIATVGPDGDLEMIKFL